MLQLEKVSREARANQTWCSEGTEVATGDSSGSSSYGERVAGVGLTLAGEALSHSFL